MSNHHNRRNGNGLNELSDRIAALEVKYRAVPQEERSVEHIASTLQEWILYRSQLNGFNGKHAGHEFKHHLQFLYEIQDDFCKGMDQLMEDYNNNHSPTREFVQDTIDKTSRYLMLYRQAGLRRIGVKQLNDRNTVRGIVHVRDEKDDTKHAIYTAFEAMLREHLAMFPKSAPKHQVFEERVRVLNLTIPIGIYAADDGDAYWSFTHQDSLLRPTGVKVQAFGRMDAAQILAESYIIRAHVLRAVHLLQDEVGIDARTLAGMLLRSHQSVIDHMQSKVKEYRVGTGAYGG